MSAAARKPGLLPKRERLRSWADQVDRSVANGRIPALLVVIVTGLLLTAFLFTDDFRVESVSVAGVQYGNAQEVVEASGLLDQSAFDADLEETAGQVAALPYVESVAIELAFPGRASISIQERLPALVVDRNDGSTLISSDAVMIASGRVDGLPVLRVPGSEEMAREVVTQDLVSAVVAIAAAYGPGAELLWSADIGLAMEIPDARLIIFGEPAEIESKLAALAAIEEQLEPDWTQLDLRVPTRPAYR